MLEPSSARMEDGRVRAVIDAVLPCVDGGRFAAKRIAGERVEIEAHCFTDGHDVLRVMLRWRAEEEKDWREVEMQPLGNDGWSAGLTPPSPGRYYYTVTTRVDYFESWHHELQRREVTESGIVAIPVAPLRGETIMYE